MEGRDGKADLHRRHTIDFSSNPSSGAGASSGTKGQEGGGGGGRRKARLWIGLGVLLVLSIGGIVVWAIARSKGPSAVGSCAKAPAFPKDRRKDKDRITLVNFNAEWLFLRGGTGQIVCPSQSCPWAVRDGQEAMEHLNNIAEVIVKLDADIYNLNEVEDCQILQDLLSLLPAGHGYACYMVKGEDAATGQNPALLTRIDPVADLKHSKARVNYPVAGSTCPTRWSGSSGSSKHYGARFRVRNSQGHPTSFVLAGFHFIAMPRDRQRCGRREAQASVIRSLVDDLREGNDLVVMAGDANDFDNETLGPDNARSISRVLEILKGPEGLVSPARSIPQAQRYSAWYDKDSNCVDSGAEEHSLIDHVLLSPEWKVESAAFYHGYTVSCRQRVSDHWPLKVTLRL